MKHTCYFERVSENAVIPTYVHGCAEDAGLDLRAAHNAVVNPGETVVVSTGLKVKLPTGTNGEVRSRSGLASKGVIVANSPGTIDPGYRGEIKVILHNLGKLPYEITIGDRIAQLVVVPYVMVNSVEAKVEPDSVRGKGGLGSTGVK